MKIGIIGKGNVGIALGTGLSRAGQEIKFSHRDPKEPVAEAAQWGDVIILAMPHTAAADVTKAVGSAADGKTVIDVSNALTGSMELAIGFTTSAAEEIQKMMPKARVVKAFNTVFAQNQNTGKIGSERLTLFVAGDDAKAKKTVMQLGADIGFEPVDGGPLKAARYLEPMGMFMISLGYVLGMGTKIGIKLVKS